MENTKPGDINKVRSDLNTLPSRVIYDDDGIPYLVLENKETEKWGHRGVPVYVQLSCTTNFLGLSEFLSGFSSDLGVEVGSCGKKWVSFYCKADGGHLLRKRRFCGHRRFCPNDAESYTRLRVHRAYGVLSGFARGLKCGLYLIHMVFTCPESLRERVLACPNDFIDVVYDVLREYRGFKGGVLAFHWWRSENPALGFHPHVHVILLNVVAVPQPQLTVNGLGVLKRRKANKYFFLRKRPYFNHLLLKAKFAWYLMAKFGYNEYKRPDVYVRYVRFCEGNRGKVLHLLKYAFRLPIQDCDRVDFGSLGVEERLTLWKVLNFRFKHIRWFGFLADGVKRFYLSFVGVDFVRLEVVLASLRRSASICPFHKVKMLLLDGG